VQIPTDKLLEIVIEGLKNNKAKEIQILNLKKLENSISEYFVICHGTSRTHVSSTANSVEKEVKDVLGEYPWKKEGHTNGEWVLVDYSSIVVHVFQKEAREFYNIEGLWGDAEITVIEDE
jgi:ribosome-associated protein